MCYSPNRRQGNQHRHIRSEGDGTQQHSVVQANRRYTLLRASASVLSSGWAAHHPAACITSPICLWTRALDPVQGSGQRRPPRLSLLTSSWRQRKYILKVIVPVTTLRNMNMNIDQWCNVFLISHLFESIRLQFIWKYSFPIVLKVFVSCNDSRCHCNVCYYGQSELWTMNY